MNGHRKLRRLQKIWHGRKTTEQLFKGLSIHRHGNRHASHDAGCLWFLHIDRASLQQAWSSLTLVLGARLYRFHPPSYRTSFHSHASGRCTERDRESVRLSVRGACNSKPFALIFFTQ